MTFPPTSSQLFASSLSIPLFLQRALDSAGFKELADFEGVTVEELCKELKIGTNQAEDLLRQVEQSRAGPSRSRRPTTQLPCSSRQPLASSSIHHAPPLLSQPVSSLLSKNLIPDNIAASGAPLIPIGWSTGSTSIDRLIDSVVMDGMSKLVGVRVEGKHGDGRMLVRSIIAAKSIRNSAREIDGEKDKDKDKDGYNDKEEEGTKSIGIRPGMIMEIAAPPGGGKTSMCVDLAIEARRGESGAEVLLVDTEGSLNALRLSMAAESMARSCSSEHPIDILKGIHLLRLTTQTELIALLHTLDEWLASRPKVKLVIIDTLSYHLRHPSMDLNSRKRILELVKQKIAKASTVNGCAVIITNQMATKLLTAENKPANFDTGDKAVMMPQLGDAWVTPKTLRLSLFKSGPLPGRRFAHLQPINTVGEIENGSVGQERPWAAFDVSIDGLIQDVF